MIPVKYYGFRVENRFYLLKVRLLTVSSLEFLSNLKWFKFWHDFLVECFRYRLVQWMLILVVK